MTFILVVAVFVLFLMHFALSGRVERLEEEVRRSKTRPAPLRPTAAAASVDSEAESDEGTARRVETTGTGFAPVRPVHSIPPPTVGTAHPGDAAPFTAPPTPSQPEEPFFLQRWFAEQPLIKIGAIIFFLGALWFVGYAIDQNWISPLTRILLGYGLGLVIGGIGVARARVALPQYQVLSVLAAGIVFGTTMAAQFVFASPLLFDGLALLILTGAAVYTLFVAVRTDTEWLATVAAIAALVSPYLTGASEPAVFALLTYLTFLSAGFLGVVFYTKWRTVGLVQLLGIIVLYTLPLFAGGASPLVLWFFVVVLSLLFFLSTTVSLLRSERPEVIDVVMMALIGLHFVYFAFTTAFSPALACFTAATAAAGCAQWFRTRGAHVDTVSLYAGIALIGVLLGTADLFSGVTLTLVFALEAALIFYFSVQLATVTRTVYVAAAVYLLPLVGSLTLFSHPDWDTGIWHGAALAVAATMVSLGGTTLWLLSSQTWQAVAWLRQLTGILLTVWYLFSALALTRVAESLGDAAGTHLLLQSLLAAVVFTLVNTLIDSERWRSRALLTIIIPTLTFLGVLGAPVWEQGVVHGTFLLCVGYVAGLIGLTLYYTYRARVRSGAESDAVSAFVLLWVTIGTASALAHQVSATLFSGAAVTSSTYVAIATILAVAISAMLALQVRFHWTAWVTWALAIPFLISLDSFDFGGFSSLGAAPAVGLYLLTLIAGFVTYRLYHHCHQTEERELCSLMSSVVGSVTGVWLFALVWMVAHTITSGAAAVALALFVYTVSGLIAYTYGRVHERRHWRIVGMLLLGSVIARLGLVDALAMDPFWRIITFLGIGALFMGTALLERGTTTASPDADTPTTTDTTPET